MIHRYYKHINLPEIGQEGQRKIKNAKVLVVGAGGLGCPVLLYLTAAGVGTIGIIDSDTVELSNLQRQVLYTENDIGKLKVTVAVERLSSQNSTIKFIVYAENLSAKNAHEHLDLYDFVIDCTDNFAARYLINDVCVQQQKTFIYGAIHRFEGQVSVLNYPQSNHSRSGTYRCLFPEPPTQAHIPNCSETGVLGVLPSLIGSLQASEALKIIVGMGNILCNQLWIIDLLTMQCRTIRFKPKPTTSRIATMPSIKTTIATISRSKLQEWQQSQHLFFLLDVREPHEFEAFHLKNSTHIPLQEIDKHWQALPNNIPIVVVCQSGKRSQYVAQQLVNTYGFNNIFNLEKGLNLWQNEKKI